MEDLPSIRTIHIARIRDPPHPHQRLKPLFQIPREAPGIGRVGEETMLFFISNAQTLFPSPSPPTPPPRLPPSPRPPSALPRPPKTSKTARRTHTTVIPSPPSTPSYSFHPLPNSSMVATGSASHPMGSWPPSHSSQSMNSWAEGEVESPFWVERMKSKIMLPVVGVRRAGVGRGRGGGWSGTFERGAARAGPLVGGVSCLGLSEGEKGLGL